VVSSQPWARVFVDGEDTGRNTPVPPADPLQLDAGKHRITLEVDDKKFTFEVEVKPGEMSKLIKTLPVSR
jgi:hypothetical protein